MTATTSEDSRVIPAAQLEGRYSIAADRRVEVWKIPQGWVPVEESSPGRVEVYGQEVSVDSLMVFTWGVVNPVTDEPTPEQPTYQCPNCGRALYGTHPDYNTDVLLPGKAP